VYRLGAHDGGAPRFRPVHQPHNLWWRRVLRKKIDNWRLTSLQQRLVKTGGRVI
jgi:hypothetical protein